MILKAIDESYAVVVCFSDELQNRERSGVYTEIYRAAKRQSERPPDRTFLFPVRLSDCRIPPIIIGGNWTIDQLKRFDLFPDAQWDRGVNVLATALKEIGRVQ